MTVTIAQQVKKVFFLHLYNLMKIILLWVVIEEQGSLLTIVQLHKHKTMVNPTSQLSISLLIGVLGDRSSE